MFLPPLFHCSAGHMHITRYKFEKLDRNKFLIYAKVGDIISLLVAGAGTGDSLHRPVLCNPCWGLAHCLQLHNFRAVCVIICLSSYLLPVQSSSFHFAHLFWGLLHFTPREILQYTPLVEANDSYHKLQQGLALLSGH